MIKPEIEGNLLQYLIQGVHDYGIFALDKDGIIISWNMGAERINGYKADEIIGKHFSIFYSEEAKQRNHPAEELKLALRDGSYEEQGWRLRKDGSRFWVNVVITALYDENGKHIGFAKVTRDLTERKTAEEGSLESVRSLKRLEETFNLMVSSVKDYAIFILNPAGIVRTWNEGAQRIKGYTADEIIGQSFSIFYTEKARAINHPAFELNEAVKNGSYEEEGWRVKKDGTQFWANVTITPIQSELGLNGFVKVTRDLSERKRVEDELEKARDEAILANQLKSKFVANVTHEIRTPLTSIVGLSQLIAEDEEVDPAVKDTGTRIFTASKQLLEILNDLLDFAKLEAGKVNVESIAYNVAVIVDQVHGLTAKKAKDKSLSFTVNIDSALPETVMGDPTKVRQILLNLVNNAIKFTEGGGIDLSAEKQDEVVLYSVTDTGIGMAKEIQSKLFKPFAQAHESTARIFGGTGLGLAIAHQFVELMQGQIGLVSKEGEGTTVWFSVPLHQKKSEHA